MLTNNKAYTMLEMIIVIMIVSIIIFVSSVSINHYQTSNQLNQVAKMIGSKYNLTKNYAQINNKKCSISLEKPMLITTCGDNQLSSYSYPKNMSVTSNFENNTISVNKKGHVSRAGTITIKLNNKEKQMTIGVGKGDYDIK